MDAAASLEDGKRIVTSISHHCASLCKLVQAKAQLDQLVEGSWGT